MESMRIGLATIYAAVLLSASPLPGQGADTASGPREPLFSRRDTYFAAGFVLGTAALAPLDRVLARELQDPDVQANRFFENSATGFEVLARPGSLIIGGSLYAVGRLAGSRRVADLGLHGTEALLLNEVLTRAAKGLFGRARPNVDLEDPYNFDLARGYEDDRYQSFPSGHTSTAFAAAAATTSELSRWWPEWKLPIGVVMYGGATMVGLSRMYHNKHWATDVIGGAALGTFSGWKVVQYTHDRPGNRLDRWLLGATALPDGQGGLVLLWSVPR